MNKAIKKAEHRRYSFTNLTILAIFITVLPGCSGGNFSNDVTQSHDMGDAAIHKVQSEQLARFMREINGTLFVREVVALDVDEERIFHSKDISKLLRQMSKRIVGLVKKDDQIKIPSGKHSLFIEYIDDLAEHGEAFESIAESGQIEDFVPTMNQTVKTCNACHDLFRDMRSK